MGSLRLKKHTHRKDTRVVAQVIKVTEYTKETSYFSGGLGQARFQTWYGEGFELSTLQTFAGDGQGVRDTRYKL